MNSFQDTADRLLGISDDWTANDIKEHLQWLIANPDEIAEGYNKSDFKSENMEAIMVEVRKLTSKKSSRELALEWWNSLSDISIQMPSKSHLCKLYHGDMRIHKSLTGSEIEQIWRRKVKNGLAE
jgi:hypothetical protein